MPNRPAVVQARKWQDRVRFHGRIIRDKNSVPYWKTFREWVFALLTAKDKQDAFEALFTFPSVTNRLAAEVQDSWSRIFDAVNPRFEIQADEQKAQALSEYLDSINENEFWKNEAISCLWESHNDFLVVDLPAVAEGGAKPYFYRVPLDVVLDGKVDKDGQCEYLIFVNDQQQRVVLCPGFYRVYDDKNVLRSEAPHNLGYCPARLLWGERVSDNAVAASSPVDECLYFLDYLAFWWVATDLFKLFGAFPIMWEVESFIDTPTTSPPVTSDVGTDPGLCYKRPAAVIPPTIGLGDLRIISPGSDPKAPVGIVEPSVASLEFQKQDRADQYGELLLYLTGSGGESNLITKALNEKQVGATFNGKENSARYISNHLSVSREWLVNTIGTLLFGPGWGKALVHFGTEFFEQNEAELWQSLQDARSAGAPQTILDEKTRELQVYRNRQRPAGAERSRILLDAEPFPQLSLEQTINLLTSGLTSRETVAVKAQFVELVAEYEMSFGADVTQIGSKLPYPQRIKLLKDFLYQNVKVSEIPTTNANPSNPDGDPQRRSGQSPV